MLLFERQEYLARVARVKEAMVKRGIDLLLVASPANQFWLTGYDGWSFYTPQMVAVSTRQEEPIWIGRKMDAVGAKFTAFLDDSNVVPYPDQYVASSDLHPLQFVADEITRRGWDKGSVGVETDDYYYTAKWDAVLRKSLSNCEFVDAFLLVNWCRMVKSERELGYMRQAGQIAAAAQQAAFDAARPGVRQCDVMAEVYRVTTAGLPEFGGTFPCKPPNAMVGEYCSAPHLSWTDDRLVEDDLFYIELGRRKTQISLSAVAMHLFGQTNGENGFRRKGDCRGAAGRARQSAPRCRLRGTRGGLEIGDCQAWN